MPLEAQGSKKGEHQKMQGPKNEDRCCEMLFSGQDVVAVLCRYDALLKIKPMRAVNIPAGSTT